MLDALEADLEVLPAAAEVVAHPIDFEVPVRNRFALSIPMRATSEAECLDGGVWRWERCPNDR